MISQMLMIFTLLTIWISLAWGLVILFSAVHFWFKHSDFRVDTSPLPYYPKVTIVVPAHNEDVVIAQTAKAILDMNYPHDMWSCSCLRITVRTIPMQNVCLYKPCLNMQKEI